MKWLLGIGQCPLLVAWILLIGLTFPPPAIALASQPAPSAASFAVMREALQQALHLRFAQALDTAARLESEPQSTLVSGLTQGIIAYFQSRWQMRPSSSPRETSHELLQMVLKEGQQQRTASSDNITVSLFMGLAAIFDALLQQQNTWLSLQLFAQGRMLLQQTLITQETTADAHLGLGMLYFTGTALPSLVQRFWGTLQQQSPDAAIRHLLQAAQRGQFSQDVAQTFLARIYELEQQYEDAIALGQTLQERFPENGHYALIVGRSQCAQHQYALCATTLGELADRLKTAPTTLARQHDRFDLYYFWGLALKETNQYAEAFSAFRLAINAEPRGHKDETLWAKYYLATLYERRGQTKTARQLYRTLLRGRNVEDLHHQVQQRLSRLR
ncbi:hypothetical protein NKDENANG_02051 [Candidatus Entotheonellaceae bacterium PAL068K]